MYPTSVEIIEALKTTDIQKYIKPVSLWKKEFYTKRWATIDESLKIVALHVLCMEILMTSNTKGCTADGLEYAYTTSTKTITLGPVPSIISTLHECGHAILGTEEIDACRFSIAIFEAVFPNERKKLSWVGHTLKQI